MLAGWLNCLLFFSPWQVTELQYQGLTESSGVCVSQDGRVVWTHNDSGDGPRIFGFGRDGTFIAEVEVDGGRAVDWEDICSFEQNGTGYLAIADVGDNSRSRNAVQIYVLKEPAIQAKRTGKLKLKVECCLTVQYPIGAIDCESLAYDPIDRVFILATKEILRCRLFEVPASDLSQDRDVEARFSASVFLPLVTGADISSDGSRMVFATYGPGCMLKRNQQGKWRAGGEANLQTFDLPARKQGESICFDRGGSRLLLTSEASPTPLYTIECPASVSGQ